MQPVDLSRRRQHTASQRSERSPATEPLPLHEQPAKDLRESEVRGVTMAVGSRFRAEVALRFRKPEAFCEAQWRCPKAVFVVYRLLMSAYSIFALIHMMLTFDEPDNWGRNFAYMTTWSFIVETLFFLLGAVLAVLHFCHPGCFSRSTADEAGREPKGQRVTIPERGIENPGFNGVGNDVMSGAAVSKLPEQSSAAEFIILSSRASVQEGTGQIFPSQTEQNTGPQSGQIPEQQVQTTLPWYIQFYWVLSNIIQTFAILVSVIYFGALYPHTSGEVSLHDVNVHAVNSVMILIDLMICARPVRPHHWLYPFLYGVLYVVFNVVYWSLDHEKNVVYPHALDWNKPAIAGAVSVTMSVVSVPLLHLANFGVYKLRLHVYQKIYRESYL